MTEDEKDQLDLLSTSREFICGLYEAKLELQGQDRAAKAIRSLVEKNLVQLCWAEDESDQNYRPLSQQEVSSVLCELEDDKYWSTADIENGYYAFDITDEGEAFYQSPEPSRYYREEWLQRARERGQVHL